MKLNSDNPQTMPVTDAVYGQKRAPKAKPEGKRHHRKHRSLGEALTPGVLAMLAASFKRSR